MVFVYGDQAYALGWFLFAADSCGVFDGSVSALQHVLADLESDVLGQVIPGGAGVLESEIEPRRELLESEALRIAAHDSLDSVTTLHGDLNQRLISEDDDPRLSSALRAWLTGVGARVRSPSRGSFEVSRRPRLQIPFALELAIAPWFGQELASSRHAAVERRIGIVRAGHGLLDEIVHHVRDDDRGIAFALVRPVPDCWPPVPVFRTDFLVRPSTTGKLDQVASAQGVSSWLQIERDSLFPPLLETVYMSDTGAEVDSPLALRPYDRTKGDRNLGSRPELFDQVTAQLDWTDACRQGLASAKAILNGRDSVRPRASRSALSLKSAIDGHLATLRGRAEPASQEIKAFEELSAAVPDELEMDVDVVGCGAVILADPKRIG